MPVHQITESYRSPQLERKSGMISGSHRITFICQNNVFSAFVYYKEEVSSSKRLKASSFQTFNETF